MMRHHMQRDETAAASSAGLFAPVSPPDHRSATGRARGKQPRVAILHQGCIPIYRRAFY